MTRRESALQHLAAAVGILPEYVDQTGRETRTTPDETRIAILRAMGIDAATGERAAAALEALRAAEAARALPPVRVVRRSDPAAAHVEIRAPRGAAAVDVTLDLTEESGEHGRLRASASPGPGGVLRVSLPRLPPEGYHRLRVRVGAGEEEVQREQSLIVVPDCCPSVREVTGRDRVFGVFANLYTVRSATNWGIGDLTDLGHLMEWTGEVGGDFLGVNPLHALRNRGAEVSPYSPVSRVFRNPIYLDVGAVPELATEAEAMRLLDSPELRAEREALRSSDRVEYERVVDLKRRILERLHRSFRERGGDERRRAYRRYLDDQGEGLTLFATFEALADHLGGGDWAQWPERFRDPRGAAVAAFRSDHADAIDFHRWAQFELDRQLGEAAARGRRAGLAIGLYQDLAIGTSPAGADIWANPGLFLRGASIGAPPDEYSASGQNWGLPPIDPRALREDAYRYWIDLVRASLRHGGALRIDHAMGLFRQFWIPEGMQGTKGAYMRFPGEDLLGILALEARRHAAVVVGEDLGTVPAEVPPALHRWNVLSSRVFYFEREGDEYRAAAEYEPQALATANTHDMPTLTGFWRGRDVEIKEEVGMLEAEEARSQAEARTRERRAILARLAAEGLVPTSATEPAEPELRAAIHAFLCRTPAAMVGLNLDDVVGEVEPVNLPGVAPERFSSWTRKLATPIERLPRGADADATLGCGERGRASRR